MTDNALDNLLHEDRRFAPPVDLAANANVTAETYAEAEATSRISGPHRRNG